MVNTFKNWFPLVVLITFVLGTVFVIERSALRSSANYPQIQLAGDWADQIARGVDVRKLDLGKTIDPALSLAPFGIVYNQEGNILTASVTGPSGMLQPEGVFDSADAAASHELRYTWQPVSGQRYAAVLKRADFQNETYYVLSGRNLREVENTISSVLWLSIIGWALAVSATLVAQHVHLFGQLVRRLKVPRKWRRQL